MITAREVLAALGVTLRGNHANRSCPVCQPEGRPDQNALSVTMSGDRLLVLCHKSGCGYLAVLDALGLALGVGRMDPLWAQEAEPARTDEDAKKHAKARKLWASGQPISGTMGEAYLRRRGITCPMPESLRWVPDIYHGPSGRFVSAMVADVTTGGVHRTYFEKSGARLTKNPKMMLGPCGGGAVVLSDREGPLVITEGIENGLSILSGLYTGPASVWAALSTSGMRALRLPELSGHLIIASDGDKEGRGAAEILRKRALSMRWTVELREPPEGLDFNDVLRGETAK